MKLLKHMIIDQLIYKIKLIRLEIIILANAQYERLDPSRKFFNVYEEEHAFDYLKDSDNYSIFHYKFPIIHHLFI